MSSTHAVEIRGGTVTKRYRSTEFDQPGREWRALKLLYAYAPDLAPDPIEADLAGDPPTVVMSRLRGVSLSAPITEDQATAIADTVETLHGVVPRHPLLDLPLRAGHPQEFLERLRSGSGPVEGASPLVRRVLEAAGEWVHRSSLDDLVRADVEPVLGTGDGNLSNFLWDGGGIQIVDFEYAGRSDRPFEIAEIIEHISCGSSAASLLLPHFELTAAESARLLECRRMMAFFWLLALLRSGHPEPLERQARHLLELLG